jgi:DNA-binding HxlR family transcriptional regulator
MDGNGWKVVMDDAGITISSDLFQLTSNSAEPNQLEDVVYELQTVMHPTYGQYCGLAKASEMIGERWGMLIVRDLLVGPRTAADLSAGLLGIPVRMLATRLREMEVSGIVSRQDDTQGSEEAVFELTEYGRSVEEALLALSRWGAAALDAPRPNDIVTENSLIMALRATFRPDAAIGVTASFQVGAGDVVVHALVEGGELKVKHGPKPDADVLIGAGSVLKGVLSGTVDVAEAIASGDMSVTGDTRLLKTFVELFQLPATAVRATV